MKLLVNKSRIIILMIILLYPVLSLEARKKIVPSSQAYQAKGPFVSSGEFMSIKNLWTSLDKLTNISSKEAFDSKCTEYNNILNNQLVAAEKKGLIGRWIRRFFESEFTDYLSDLAQQKGFETAPAQLTETETIQHFGKELGFLHEGFYTLLQMKEYDSWLFDLLVYRSKRVFTAINQISFKTRLDYLKQSSEQYKEKLLHIQDTYNNYRAKAAPYSKAIVVGKVNNEVISISVRRPGENWRPLNERREQELYEDDLIEVPGQIDKLTLLDRRYLLLEPDSILMGWELNPILPSNLQEDINKLIIDLGNDEWSIREAATKSLIEIGEPAVPALEKALEHKDPEVRLRAKIILYKIGRGGQYELERQVRELVVQMNNQRDRNWYNAYQTLMNMAQQDASVLKILQKMINEITNQRVHNLVQAIIKVARRNGFPKIIEIK